MKILRFLLLAFALSPMLAQAGILIEPYAGYASLTSSGTVDISGTQGEIEESTLDGMVYGGRLGVGISNFGIGVDYSQAPQDDGGELKNLGAFGMVSFLNLRFWGTYVFSSQIAVELEDYNEKGTFKGDGVKVGLGWSILPFVSLNAEYMMINNTKEDLNTFTGVDQDLKGYLVTLSFPFVL